MEQILLLLLLLHLIMLMNTCFYYLTSAGGCPGGAAAGLTRLIAQIRDLLSCAGTSNESNELGHSLS